MGGLGSGEWYRYDKKSTVEESLTVAVRDFIKGSRWRFSGTLTWRWAGGNESSIGYSINWGDERSITLHYRMHDREDVRIRIRVQSTLTNFNGERYWFTCPLVGGGVACNRRVGKLCLPPGGRYFGCRHCHKLSYESRQETHQSEDRFLKWAERMKLKLERRR